MISETYFFFLVALFFRSLGGDKGSEFLHQAALAAGGGVLVDHAFASGFIEFADGFEDQLLWSQELFPQRRRVQQ